MSNVWWSDPVDRFGSTSQLRTLLLMFRGGFEKTRSKVDEVLGRVGVPGSISRLHSFSSIQRARSFPVGDPEISAGRHSHISWWRLKSPNHNVGVSSHSMLISSWIGAGFLGLAYRFTIRRLSPLMVTSMMLVSGLSPPGRRSDRRWDCV